MSKKALITGVAGQDGAYLAQLLIEKGYEVYGTYRRSANFSPWRLQELGVAERVRMVELELLEFSNIIQVLRDIQPDEIYNLAAQSFVASSFKQPLYTTDVDCLGPARILEAMRTVSPHSKFYQASTSEMFGKVQAVPQSETTPFYPRSPYGVAKLGAHWMTINYRESYSMFACSGILFNHESPLRGREFVTRKITSELALVKQGRERPLELGNMDAKRDWGFAGDYVKGMWLMLQQDKPDDFVLATGQTQTVRSFIEAAMPFYGFDLEWQGKGEKETGIDRKSGKTIIRINPEFYRPAEVDLLLGDPAKAEKQLGWKRAYDLPMLVEAMAKADLERAARKIL